MQLFDAVGKEPKIIKAPVLLFDLIIGSLDFLAKYLPKQFEDPAELAKIGKYYAVENMLTTDPQEKVISLPLKKKSYTFGCRKASGVSFMRSTTEYTLGSCTQRNTVPRGKAFLSRVCAQT